MEFLTEYFLAFGTSYWTLFAASFLAATILPFSSEIILGYMLTQNANVAVTLFAATSGNNLFDDTTSSKYKSNTHDFIKARTSSDTLYKFFILPYFVISISASTPFFGANMNFSNNSDRKLVNKSFRIFVKILSSEIYQNIE